MGNRLSKIVTRTGDDGSTGLADVRLADRVQRAVGEAGADVVAVAVIVGLCVTLYMLLRRRGWL